MPHSSADNETQRDWTRDQLSQLVEMERAQIGHDLHDDLLPLLFAARAGVQRLHNDLQREESASDAASESVDHAAALDQIAGWLDQAMQCGRRLISHIQSPEIDRGSWRDAVEDRVETLFGDSLDVSWHLSPDALDLPAELATAAYRITVEAIRNAVRHGRATQVSVASASDAGHRRIEISDDGLGFDPTSVGSDHFGIRIMKRRAELAGGQLWVQSSPGEPTTVVFSFPQAEA